MIPTTRVSRLASWLESIELGEYTTLLLANDVDLSVLPDLTDQDLHDFGIALGHRNRLIREARRLRTEETAADAAAGQRAGFLLTAPTPERRRVTIVFTDLLGSTDLAVRYDPDDLHQLILDYQNRCRQVIDRWGGHVINYLGDGVVICFGYPVTHEDSAERAVRAAMEIVDQVGRLPPFGGTRLRTRVGIATGEVVIGTREGDESVAGETPNLAARLQDLAKAGHIVISAGTRCLIRGMFALESLGKHRLKGFPEPLEVWEVKADLRRTNRYEARRERRLPLIGRDREFRKLKTLWRQARAGAGKVVLVSGEVGIGKSHLCNALGRSVADQHHLRLRYFCSPHRQNSMLFPVIAQLERSSGIKPGDDNATRLAKLEARLVSARNGPSKAVALIADLMSIECDARYPPLDSTGQRRRIEALHALLDEVSALAQTCPLLLFFEDAHWCDPTTLELFGMLAQERIERLPILLLVTYRPNFHTRLQECPWISNIRLDRVKASDSRKMIAGITEAEGIPEELATEIVAKSDGVPLFVEELTKVVLEMDPGRSAVNRQAGDHPLALPETLHDSLMSRLDRLQAAKPVAQLGAVIGRRFTHGVLSAVAGLDQATLCRALDDLVTSGLVQRHGEAPSATYTFKHALVQEAAYATLLRSRVRRLHGRIAEVLQNRFPEMARAEPEVMAHHFERAGMAGKAFDCLMTAGLEAISRAAQKEAVNHLEAAAAMLEGLPETAESRKKCARLQTLLTSARNPNRTRKP